MKPLEEYLKDTKPWTDVVKGRHVLFDTNAIVGIMAYKAEGVFDEMQKSKITRCFIDPVNIELLNTNDSKLRIERQSLLATRGFYKLPLDPKSLARSTEIQAWLSTQKIFLQ